MEFEHQKYFDKFSTKDQRDEKKSVSDAIGW